MAFTAKVFFTPGQGYGWTVYDNSGAVFAESNGFVVDEATAAADAESAAGASWPGSYTDGTWHYVGEVGEPAFENSWANVVAGKYQLSYRVARAGEVDLHGQITGGANGDTIFTLPAELAPASNEYINAIGLDDGTGAFTPVLVQVVGALVFPAWSPGATVDELFITGSYYLTPPTGP